YKNSSRILGKRFCFVSEILILIFFITWKFHADFQAHSVPGIDGSPMVCHNPLYNGKSQAAALTAMCSCFIQPAKALKNFFQTVFCHSRPIICYTPENPVSPLLY